MNKATFTNAFDEEITVSIGDVVYFKSDIEQSGEVTKIIPRVTGGYYLTLGNSDGFEGRYIGGQKETVQHSEYISID